MEWIKVSEQLPNTERVIVNSEYGVTMADYISKLWFVILHTQEQETAIAKSVTHWMPLPEPPKPE